MAKHKKSTITIYQKFAAKSAEIIGNEWAFNLALLYTLGWLATGPLFNFSDTWQLVINTSTTIVTFLIVFLIQNSQYRDAKAIQVKLDELLRCHKLAHNSVIDLDTLSDEALKALEHKYKELAKKRDNPSEKNDDE